MANRAAIELVAALAVGAVSAAAVAESYGYRGASSYMPTIIAGFAVALSAIWALQSAVALARGTWAPFEITGAAVLRFATIVAVTALYVLGITYAGFFTSTVVMVPLFAFLIGYRNLPVALIATAGFCVILYCVFRLLLKIPLPPETLLEQIGL